MTSSSQYFTECRTEFPCHSYFVCGLMWLAMTSIRKEIFPKVDLCYSARFWTVSTLQ